MNYLKILEELDWPPIYMISPEQFEHVDGSSMESDCGISSVDYPVFSIHRGLRGRVRANVIFHEILHHLFPYRKHWWIECAAEKLARGGGRGYWSAKYGHTPDELPPRSYLVKLARRASARLKRKLSSRTNVV